MRNAELGDDYHSWGYMNIISHNGHKFCSCEALCSFG